MGNYFVLCEQKTEEPNRTTNIVDYSTYAFRIQIRFSTQNCIETKQEFEKKTAAAANIVSL